MVYINYHIYLQQEQSFIFVHLERIIVKIVKEYRGVVLTMFNATDDKNPMNTSFPVMTVVLAFDEVFDFEYFKNDITLVSFFEVHSSMLNVDLLITEMVKRA
jgi:hypothetical protein